MSSEWICQVQVELAFDPARIQLEMSLRSIIRLISELNASWIFQLETSTIQIQSFDQLAHVRLDIGREYMYAHGPKLAHIWLNIGIYVYIFTIYDLNF